MVHCGSSWLGACWEMEDLLQSACRGVEESGSAAVEARRSRRERFRKQGGRSREELQADGLLGLLDRIALPPSLQHLEASGRVWPLAAVAEGRWLEMDWEAMPAGADPGRGGGYKDGGSERGERKKWQVRSVAGILASLRPWPGSVVVDFGCGSGALTLPLAASFPELLFVGVDFKRRSVELLLQRARGAGLRNVSGWCGRIEDFSQPFDVCVALHACGSATDLALLQALARNCAYIVSPCCLGKLQLACQRPGETPHLLYPRSRWLRSSISTSDFAFLARTADWSSYHHHHSTSQLHSLCKALVELDRNQACCEQGYVTSIFSLPISSAGVIGISLVLVGKPPHPSHAFRSCTNPSSIQ